MAFGVTVLFVVAIASQVAEGAAWQWARPLAREAACSSPGALRTEPSGALSVCAAAGGAREGYAWTQPDAAQGTARADPDCTGLAGQWVCATTCATNGICLDNGQWLFAQNCSASNYVCLNNTCVPGSIDSCPTLDIPRCLASDTYPSLIDCSLYYTCDTLTGIGVGVVNSCPSGLYYDACQRECDVAASGTCSWATSNPCDVPGTYGVAPNNDRLYYVCLTQDGATYPLWNKCTTGHFNLTTLSCDRTDEPGCGSGDEGGGGDDDNETTTTTTTTTTEPPFTCSGAGINPNPATNCSFYYCYPDGYFILVSCADGYHFDAASASCILGQCT